jgi:hypothetical protein
MFNIRRFHLKQLTGHPNILGGEHTEKVHPDQIIPVRKAEPKTAGYFVVPSQNPPGSVILIQPAKKSQRANHQCQDSHCSRQNEWKWFPYEIAKEHIRNANDKARVNA